mmetsp:Transcript_19589/g.25326  ORF Transcript_19589/g.25326 Transcript_19589/m.25326 type:complete len:107 (-) Transcript_19589:192-512(-)
MSAQEKTGFVCIRLELMGILFPFIEMIVRDSSQYLMEKIAWYRRNMVDHVSFSQNYLVGRAVNISLKFISSLIIKKGFGKSSVATTGAVSNFLSGLTKNLKGFGRF